MNDKPMQTIPDFKEEMSFHISLAKNGVIVKVCEHNGMDVPEGGGDDTYVYKTLDEALKEIKGMASVNKAENDDGLPPTKTEKETAAYD